MFFFKNYIFIEKHGKFALKCFLYSNGYTKSWHICPGFSLVWPAVNGFNNAYNEEFDLTQVVLTSKCIIRLIGTGVSVGVEAY